MMKDEILDEISERFACAVEVPHHAAAIGYLIFLLKRKFGMQEDEDIEKLRARFMASLEAWGFEDLLENQMRYAMRIADHPSAIETEEMYKIFSLCNHVHALEDIGLSTDESMKEAYISSLRELFSRERRRAKIAAEDTVDDWSAELWWYRENLAV